MIAVIFAMNEEAAVIKKTFEDCFSYGSKLSDLMFVKDQDRKYIFALSGIGKTNMAATTALVINNLDVDLVINIGTCGSINPELRPLDLVLINKISYFDVDVTPFNYQHGQVPHHNLEFKISEKYYERVNKILKSCNFHFNEHITLGTGDTFINKTTITKFPSFKTRRIDVIDMEGAACAQICEKNGTPFISLKIVSDNIDSDKNNADFSKTLEDCAKKISDVLTLILPKLAEN